MQLYNQDLCFNDQIALHSWKLFETIVRNVISDVLLKSGLRFRSYSYVNNQSTYLDLPRGFNSFEPNIARARRGSLAYIQS